MKLATVLMFACCSAASAEATAGSQLDDPEIGYLLHQIRASGCQFVRNGTAHDSDAAATHLEIKYSRAKRYVDDASQFIARIGTESSWSGKSYFVDCDGYDRVSSADWLHEVLVNHRLSQDRDNS